MKAKLDQAASDWERAQKLGPSDALSQSDYNTYKANFGIAQANVGVDEAAITQAKATVAQSEAALKKAQQSLAYCTITSPVKGVIIDRRVTIGETVVSSLNSPSLFLIAKDLTQIQVWVSVNEADIGNIRPDQPVTFTVDAYPGKTFHGTVGKVRLNATMTQNVVTYTVEVNTENLDSKLLPYLTANVQFEVNHLNNALLVSNAALRWYPDPQMVAPDVRAAWRKKQRTPPATPVRPRNHQGLRKRPLSQIIRRLPGRTVQRVAPPTRTKIAAATRHRARDRLDCLRKICPAGENPHRPDRRDRDRSRLERRGSIERRQPRRDRPGKGA